MMGHRGTLARAGLAIAFALFSTLLVPAQTGSSAEDCLVCHGPFDRLVAATADYKWPGGEVQSPHRYVPHDSTTIADCLFCHEAHPLPPSASDIAAISKPKPEYCFECHHTRTFACGTCHPVPSD